MSPLTGGVSNNRAPLFKLRTEVGFSFETDVLHDGIRWGKSANFTQTPILNRSSPIITFANSNPIMLSVTLNLFVTSEDEFDGGPGYVVRVLESITALTFPVEPGIQPPTLCYITLAGYSLFNEWACVLPSFEASHGMHNVWDNDGSPMTGSVSLQFMGVEIENRSASELVSRGDFRQFAFRGNSGSGTTQAPNPTTGITPVPITLTPPEVLP